MEEWQKLEIEGKMRKALKSKLGLLGKPARRMFEEGIIVIDSFPGEEPEYFIMFAEDDLEQLLGLPFEIWDEEKGCFVEDSDDIKPFFDLTDEEKAFLKLDENQIIKSI
jgi:hypothetical protein